MALAYSQKNMQHLFEKIYSLHSWYDEESKSGPGASLKQTETVRQVFSKLLKDFHIKTLLDIPCGDFNWMKDVDLSLYNYVGADIVNDIIKQNDLIYSKKNKRFVWGDITVSPLPKVDLVLCRDCLVHFSYADISNSITNIKKSRAKFLLTTTFTNRTNEDIVTGYWRPINLEADPFHFPKPLQLFNENCTEENGRYSDKSLGLWKVDDLPLSLA
jgi:2-polyprenyl-3-methyl-5-hydroxy-6-metoxy-1,4-benzoquinol methylase